MFVSFYKFEPTRAQRAETEIPFNPMQFRVVASRRLPRRPSSLDPDALKKVREVSVRRQVFFTRVRQ